MGIKKKRYEMEKSCFSYWCEKVVLKKAVCLFKWFNMFLSPSDIKSQRIEKEYLAHKFEVVMDLYAV